MIVKNKLSHSTSTEVIILNSSVLSPCFWADQGTSDSFRESTDPYVLYIDSHLSFKTMTLRNIIKEIIAVKGLGIVVFWNFVVIFAFYNSCFIVVLDSTIRMSACFWLFGVQWLTYDCLWPRDLRDDSLILEALHHYKPILDRRRRTKCSAFKIRRQPITFLLLENEFWVQRHGYETDDLKNNLQTKIFDEEWKRSGFI